MGALFLHLSVPISCSIRRSTAHTPIMHPHSPLRAAVRQITMHRSPIIGPETTEPQLRFDTRSEYVGPFRLYCDSSVRNSNSKTTVHYNARHP
jgi:hypothetical protein